jgi:predicted transposase YdaD
MAKAFDATTRQLIEMGPAAWLEYLGIPVPDPARIRVIDSNLSTIIPEADRVIWIEVPEPWIEHLELQAGRDVRFTDRAHLYSVVLESHYQVPVRTTLVLLREAADGTELTGVLEKRYRDGTVYDSFRYDIVRIWEQPVERFLQAGLPVLPLAPVSNVGLDRLGEVLTAVARRLHDEATPDQTATLWRATTILLSLRYSREQVEEIVQEVSTMWLGIRGIEDSWLYQDYLKGRAEGMAEGRAEGMAEGKAEGKAEGRAEGRLDGAREDLLRLGRKKFGPPGDAVLAEIKAIDDPDRLAALLERILDVSTWDELLAPAAP